MQWLSKCLYCQNNVYRLQDGRIKCSTCHKKLSLQKINKIIMLIDGFINDESALSLSKRNKLSYISVKNYYDIFRMICAKISESEYEDLSERTCEYEEYFYLEKSKKSDKEAVFDAHNFLTFDYNNHIYTLLMPSLQQYKSQFIEDNVTQTYINEFNKFKRNNKIIKVSKHVNNIVKFWKYFEKAILKYKGIQNDNFIYFLKECEFKYNHTKEEAIQLLITAYFKGKQ